jgi:hypothetical protein
MQILFPHNPLNEKQADEPFQNEYHRLKSMGVTCSLFDYDALIRNELTPKPQINWGDAVLYRGWMLTPPTYEKFSSMIGDKGGKMLTSPSNFILSHHLPQWYTMFVHLTAETVFIQSEENLKEMAEKLGWGQFFVKDYVKSNYNEIGSIATSPQEVIEIVNIIKQHRGGIEGGISLRRVEEYIPKTEQRYFVFNRKPYAPDGGNVPELVVEISKKHPAVFFSVDVAQRVDGVFRLIEIGDGQVSDKKEWGVEGFCDMLAENI